jgi:cytochrome c oxidase subunit IV
MSQDNGVSKIWKTFFFLLGLTVVEVALGIIKPEWMMVSLMGTSILNYVFIILTLVKAFYIVSVFMHLGDEKKSFRYAIYLPAIILIPYLTFILMEEGAFIFDSAGGVY